MSDAWPFLVSRNRVRDYQPLVAPGFLIDKRGTGQLIGLPVGGSDGAGTRREAHLDKTPAGRIAVVYRAVEARLNGEVLRDMAGRPVLRIEGVIVRDGTSAERVRDEILEEAHRVVEPDFQSFWNTTERAQIRRSMPIPLPPNPKHTPHHRAKRVLLAFLPASVVLLSIYYWASSQNGDAVATLSAKVEKVSTEVAAVHVLATEVVNLRQELAAQTAASESLAADVAKLKTRLDAVERRN